MIEVYSPRTPRGPGVVLATEADYLAVLENLVNTAKLRVDALAFSFAVGSAEGRLNFRSRAFKVMELFKRAAQRGVAVRFFLEGERDTAARNHVTGAHLAKAGIEVRYGSTHAKGVAVDGRYLLVGSTNLTDQSLLKNYETNVLVDARPVVTQFERYYAHYWNGGAHGGVRLKAPLLADGDWLPALIKVIGAARTRLDFSIYFFDQKDVADALTAAARRGVAVRGLVHHHRTFGLDDVRRTRATVAKLRAAGLDDLHFAAPVRFTHSKYLVRDRTEVMLGTGNWLDRDVVTYPQLYVKLKHPPLARALVKHLGQQIDQRRS